MSATAGLFGETAPDATGDAVNGSTAAEGQNSSELDSAKELAPLEVPAPTTEYATRNEIDDEDAKTLFGHDPAEADPYARPAEPEPATPPKQAEPAAEATPTPTPEPEKKRKSLASKIRTSLGLPKGEKLLSDAEIAEANADRGAESPAPASPTPASGEKPVSLVKSIRKSLGLSSKKALLSDEELAKIAQEVKDMAENGGLKGFGSSSPKPAADEGPALAGYDSQSPKPAADEDDHGLKGFGEAADPAEATPTPTPEPEKKRKSLASKIRKSLGLPTGEKLLSDAEIAEANAGADSPTHVAREGKPVSLVKSIRKSLGLSSKKALLSDEELAKIAQEEKDAASAPASAPAPAVEGPPKVVTPPKTPPNERAAATTASPAPASPPKPKRLSVGQPHTVRAPIIMTDDQVAQREADEKKAAEEAKNPDTVVNPMTPKAAGAQKDDTPPSSYHRESGEKPKSAAKEPEGECCCIIQ
jgi:hypothetical protein